MDWKIEHTTADGRNRWEAQVGKFELSVLEWVDNCTWYVSPGWKITPVRGEPATVDEAKEMAEEHYRRVVKMAEPETQP